MFFDPLDGNNIQYEPVLVASSQANEKTINNLMEWEEGMPTDEVYFGDIYEMRPVNQAFNNRI